MRANDVRVLCKRNQMTQNKSFRAVHTTKAKRELARERPWLTDKNIYTSKYGVHLEMNIQTNKQQVQNIEILEIHFDFFTDSVIYSDSIFIVSHPFEIYIHSFSQSIGFETIARPFPFEIVTLKSMNISVV